MLNAQGEIDVILDLVNGVEDGQHLAIGMVTPGQKSMQAQNRERMLALSAKQTALQASRQFELTVRAAAVHSDSSAVYCDDSGHMSMSLLARH